MRLPQAVMTGTIACVAWGCSPPPVDVEAERASLREAAAAYHAAASAKDVGSVVSRYDADAIMVPPNADPVEGIEAIRDYRFGFIETPGVELRFEIVRVEVSDGGDIGWTLSVGDVTFPAADGQPGRDRIRDFHTWRKQDDGTWRVVVDMWSSELPAGG